ncbi:hypothetical protein BH11ARM2_BH11ARM2_11820 [soil metagenome]
MVSTVRRWSPVRLPSLALRRIQGSKQNGDPEPRRRLGVLESWQLALERQADLVLRSTDHID